MTIERHESEPESEHLESQYVKQIENIRTFDKLNPDQQRDLSINISTDSSVGLDKVFGFPLTERESALKIVHELEGSTNLEIAYVLALLGKEFSQDQIKAYVHSSPANLNINLTDMKSQIEVADSEVSAQIRQMIDDFLHGSGLPDVEDGPDPEHAAYISDMRMYITGMIKLESCLGHQAKISDRLTDHEKTRVKKAVDDQLLHIKDEKRRNE